MKHDHSGAVRYLDVEFDARLRGGAERLERSAQCKLLDVVAGSTAANDDLRSGYLNLQPLDSPSGALGNPVFDHLFAFRRL